MTASVRLLLESFERLSDSERYEAAVEILRRTPLEDDGPLDDETIDRIAEESFLEYDAREAADAESGPG